LAYLVAAPHAISVGASEHSDRLMYFSAVGPAKWKDLTLKKPELVAPGFKIYSASSNGRYKEQLGTSMAAPHVSGTFALLRQAILIAPVKSWFRLSLRRLKISAMRASTSTLATVEYKGKKLSKH
jgi:subtilisin family serine protease